MYGAVGPKGLFGGSKNAYLYPDLSVALVGEFKDGKMVETKPVTLKEAFFEKFDTIMRLRFSLPANGAFRYLFKRCFFTNKTCQNSYEFVILIIIHDYVNDEN